MNAADYSALYDPDSDFDRWYTILAARRILPCLAPDARVLELGSATGLLTRAIAAANRRIVCVERSAAYLARAGVHPGVELVHSAIETYAATSLFDDILAINVLHELPDPAAALRRLLPHLRPGGTLHVTLPNPRSLHRLSALGAGLIADLQQPSPRGEVFHTLRLPFAEQVAADMARLGLTLLRQEAILVKPLPNAAMATVSDEIIEAWDDLAAALPEHGAMTWFMFRATDG